MASDVFGLVGTIIDQRYRIDAAIGEGGFGVVYRAYHLAFQHAVAVKCLKLPGHFTPEAQALFVEKFREEGAFLSRLSEHGSIVRVFDLNVTATARAPAVPYLVLEWLEGRELEAQLEERRRRGEPPHGEAEAIAVLRPAVDAVAFAHEHRIAHRDLKPANLFESRTSKGTVLKVLDFGIAKAMQDGETATQMASRTSSGFSAFSPHYGAPEQFRAKRHGATGPWTDVHALGLMLTELVSGKRPMDGEEIADFYERGTSELRPTPRARGAMVSDAFEAVCAKALALDPRARFQSAGELGAALDGLRRPIANSSVLTAEETAVPAPLTAVPAMATVVAEPISVAEAVASPTDEEIEVAPRRRGRSGWLWAVLVAAVVASGVTGALVVRSPESGPRNVEAPSPVPQPDVEEPVVPDPLVILPITSLRTPATATNVKVILTETGLLVAPPEVAILHFDDPASRAGGAPAALKRNGPNDLYITPLASVLAARKEQEGSPESPSELAILADQSTPYRLLFEALFTAGQSGYGTFHLVVRGKEGLSSIATSPPSLGRGAMSSDGLPDALNLAVLIVDDGVAFKTSFGNVAPGCATVAKGLTVPNAAGKGAYDLKGIRDCARELKAANDGKFAAERVVTITASRAIEYRHLIAVIEAVRGDSEELFPVIQLGVAK